ncbi:hypothetical protein [Microbacterium sp. H1-D42]|uniref:hypothetical protein n=1 Tax=Microbacterium sp. H1-D42 TaxID=2925844 RepID=UPI001F53CB33|nr:hypothetical protein [Microbacterium sp. H1-D42]UNK71736.1 hypothetical protein MNR00_04560 [Microbacterium sp. H1-D42]
MNTNNNWDRLTQEQKERATGEFVMHTRGGADPRALARMLDRMESLATSAALWNLWVTEQIEVAWDEGHQEIAWYVPEPDEEDER